MNPLTFTDFCSGIGGGRIGLENLGMTCFGFREIDKEAELTYREFFGKDEVNPNDLPNFDFMVGDFPCQLNAEYMRIINKK